MLDYTTTVAAIASGLSNATTGVPSLIAATVPIALVFIGAGLFYKFVRKAMNFD